MDEANIETVNNELEMLSLQTIDDNINKKCEDIENDPEKLHNIIKKLQAEIKSLHKKQNALVKYFEKEKEILKTKTSRELLDKLSSSHKELLKNQEYKFEEIIKKDRENHELNLNSICKYYEDIIKDFQRKQALCKTLVEANENLAKDNESLQSAMLTNNKKLDNIQNLILGQPIDISAEIEVKDFKENLAIKKEEYIDLTTTHETDKIHSLTKEIGHLNTVIIDKDTQIYSLTEQLNVLKELNIQYDREKSQLLADNIALTMSLDNMQMRHGEQFKEYEKLLKKSKHEIDVHKREIMRLREHISSQNFQASPIVTKQRQFIQIHHSSSSPNLSNNSKKYSDETHISNLSESLSNTDSCVSETSTPVKEGDVRDLTKKPRGRPRKLQTPKK